MIAVKLEGRLGNQLFQYAFAFVASKKLNTFYTLEGKLNSHLFKFKLRKFETVKLRISNFIFWQIHKGKLEHLVNHHNGLKYNRLSIKNSCTYSGYFQSEKYFKSHKQEIQQLFEIKKVYRNTFKVKFEKLFESNKVISIHIRSTDYAEIDNPDLGGGSLILPISYYKNCLNKIENLNQYKILVFGDDTSFFKNNFKTFNNFNFVSNDEITDLLLLMNSDICIISNSTFAWWGAYLNKKKEKKIFTPKYWLGHKVKKNHPIEITHPSWEEIEVN